MGTLDSPNRYQLICSVGGLIASLIYIYKPFVRSYIFRFLAKSCRTGKYPNLVEYSISCTGICIKLGSRDDIDSLASSPLTLGAILMLLISLSSIVLTTGSGVVDVAASFQESY